MLNDPSPAPPSLYYNNIEGDNGTAPWQEEEALIRSLSLGMKDWLDHPAAFFCFGMISGKVWWEAEVLS